MLPPLQAKVEAPHRADLSVNKDPYPYLDDDYSDKQRDRAAKAGDSGHVALSVRTHRLRGFAVQAMMFGLLGDFGLLRRRPHRQ